MKKNIAAAILEVFGDLGWRVTSSNINDAAKLRFYFFVWMAVYNRV
jgi:hypothetical protein